MDEVIPPLYRYFNSARAIEALEQGSLTWMRPTVFNDPFDSQWSLVWPARAQTFVQDLARKIESIVTAIDTPNFALFATERRAQLEVVRNNYHTGNQEERAKVLERMRNSLPKAITGFCDGLDTICEQNLNQMRVVCLSEVPDCVLMWGHYGDSHKGVVLELDHQCMIPQQSNVVRQVIYTSSMPAVWSRESLIDYFLYGALPGNSVSAVNSLVVTKSDAWRYEREWRLVMHTNVATDGDYVTLPFFGKCVKSIRIGLKASDDVRSKVMDIASARYPGVPVLQASRRNGRFALAFSPIQPST